MTSLLLILFLISSTWATELHLYNFTDTEAVDQFLECSSNSEKYVQSCRAIKVDFDLIERGRSCWIPELDLLMTRTHHASHDDTNGYMSAEYENKHGDNALLSVNFEKNQMFATIHAQGKVYEITNDKHGNHVLIEYKAIQRQNKDEPIRTDIPNVDLDRIRNLKLRSFRDRGLRDGESYANVSIKFYYTTAVASNVSNLDALFQNLIDQVNDGYINSNVPIHAYQHGQPELLADFQDGRSCIESINAFATAKAPLCKLRDGADQAVLIVEDIPGICAGVAYVHNAVQITYGLTVSVVERFVAQTEYALSHELAHNYGADHDPENANVWTAPYGFGHLIKDGGNEPSGYHTIMAYQSSQYPRPTNRYSSSVGTWNGWRLGNHWADNARLLTERRFLMANVDDENTSTNCACVDWGVQWGNSWCQQNWNLCNMPEFGNFIAYCPRTCRRCR